MFSNAPVATVLGSIPASVGTVESEGRQMKQSCYKIRKILGKRAKISIILYYKISRERST